jgi:hypothetical protein
MCAFCDERLMAAPRPRETPSRPQAKVGFWELRRGPRTAALTQTRLTWCVLTGGWISCR